MQTMHPAIMASTPVDVLARDTTTPSNEHSLRRRLSGQGSLPLKKRRFSPPMPSAEAKENPLMNGNTGQTNSTDIPLLSVRKESRSIAFLSSKRTSPVAESEDEKIAALALVAAAVSHVPSLPSVSQSSSSAAPANSAPSTPEASRSLLMPCGPAIPTALPRESLNQKTPITPTTTPKRLHHPPLASPLPNGCHGRTSRNNSFCRRQPCYNGSKYCKLHYQQYIVAGTRSPSISTESQGTVSITGTSTTSQASSIRSAVSMPAALLAERVPPLPNMHQDKRYTGSGDEKRCQATTTRGRSCAYVAVNRTKYCYLHADYDTNPPPRRGGASQRKFELLSKQIGQTSPICLATKQMTPSTILPVPGSIDRHSSNPAPAILTPPSCSPSSSVISDDSLSDSSRSPVMSRPAFLQGVSPSSAENASKKLDADEHSLKRLSWKPRLSPTSSRDATNHSYTLLSMISTDQWFHKKVIVSTGPLMNRCGRVEKWGNGWVSVRIAGVGVHNRRSFELFLHPDQLDGGKDEDPPLKKGPRQNLGVLRRCVSREGTTDTANPRNGTMPDKIHATASNGVTTGLAQCSTATTSGSPLSSLGSRLNNVEGREVSSGSSDEEEQQVSSITSSITKGGNRDVKKPSLFPFIKEKPSESVPKVRISPSGGFNGTLERKPAKEGTMGTSTTHSNDGLAKLADAMDMEQARPIHKDWKTGANNGLSRLADAINREQLLPVDKGSMLSALGEIATKHRLRSDEGTPNEVPGKEPVAVHGFSA